MLDTKYPNIEVQLSGESDNAFFILGKVKNALRNAGVSSEEVSEFVTEAKAGDYDHLLQTCMRWVEVS
jgi:hypothetical protein